LMDLPVLALISSLADRVGNLPPEDASYTSPTFKAYWMQLLSCSLWRENARMIDTVIQASADFYKYESYNSKSYENTVYPQFQFNSTDFPLLQASATSMPPSQHTSVPSNASTIAAAATSTATTATSVTSLVDLTLDPDQWSDDDDFAPVALSLDGTAATTSTSTTSTEVQASTSSTA